MSKSGLYAHFGSKEELQLATVETAKETFDAEVVEPAAEIADPLQRVEALYHAFLSHLERRNTAFVLHGEPEYLHKARAAILRRLQQAT
jgi:AcrR family transcriptional regulator